MDVFKYLKQVNNHIKEGAADDAREMGLEYAGYGKWKDPKTGKTTHKSVKSGGQTTLQQLDKEEEPQKQDKKPEEKKTYGDFKKDAQPEAPERMDLSVAKDADPEKTAEYSAMAASQGMWPHFSDERKQYHIDQQKAMAAQAEAESEAAASAEEEKAAKEAEKVAKEQEKISKEITKSSIREPEDFKTVDEVITNRTLEESGKNFDGSEKRGDVDIATDESIQRIADISKTDVKDSRFDIGRQSQEQFLNHYSKDSDYRDGLNTLSKSVAKANDRTKVNEMMDAIGSGDLDRQIELKKGDNRSVSDLLSDAGIDANNEEQVRQFAKAYEEISSFIGDDGSWKRGESHELVGSNLGYYESKHIAERDDLGQLDPSGIQTKAFNLAGENKTSMSKMDPVITDAVFSILPTPARDFLSKSGSPKTFYNPTEKDQQSKTANPIRGSAALHMWAMQDGKDAYALSGQRRSPGEFQVEHITPLKSGGKDHIENFAMLLRRVNEPRADLDFGKFLDQSKRKRDSVDADLANPKTRKNFETKYRASSFNSELSPSVGGSVSDLMSDKILNSVNSGLEAKLGKDSSAALKVKPEVYKEYQTKMNDFLEKNKLKPDTQVKDMSSDQINGVFDIMGESLGVDKAKMNEYMGRNVINNYDSGARFVINKDGKLEKGRGGTSPTSGAVLNMQNSIISDDSMSPEDKSKALQTANEYHQQFKKSRNDYIDNPDSPEAYENYLSDVVLNIDFLTGEGDSPLKSGRQYDNRLTYSDRNNIDNDTANGIMSMLSLDTASVGGGKDAFSPGFQKVELTPQSKKLIKSLRKKLISSYVKTTGFSEDEIMNPDSLKKTKRKKIEPLINALENIDRGLAQ